MSNITHLARMLHVEFKKCSGRPIDFRGQVPYIRVVCLYPINPVIMRHVHVWSTSGTTTDSSHDLFNSWVQNVDKQHQVPDSYRKGGTSSSTYVGPLCYVNLTPYSTHSGNDIHMALDPLIRHGDMAFS